MRILRLTLVPVTHLAVGCLFKKPHYVIDLSAGAAPGRALSEACKFLF